MYALHDTKDTVYVFENEESARIALIEQLKSLVELEPAELKYTPYWVQANISWDDIRKWEIDRLEDYLARRLCKELEFKLDKLPLEKENRESILDTVHWSCQYINFRLW